MRKSTQQQQKIFIGVSWPYANGNIHIGHLAGQYVICDVFARYHRLKSNRVLMVSGSDSHGAPVLFAAEDAGTVPDTLASESHELIKDTYRKLGFLYEKYTSTRTDNHKIVAQNIFLVLNELGFLSIKKTKQYFDPSVKRFLPDRYVRGTCPKCKASNARGDECPECGEMLDPVDLINPYSTLSDATPVLKETEHYYLDLSKVQPDLEKWLEDKTYWRKWVREFTLGWLRDGLKPRAVTRDFTFGVPVPMEGWEHKVLYVWIEAVVGYLSASIEWAHTQKNLSLWEDFWKDPKCNHYYFIAGGNVPFHTIIWPAELIGYNRKYKNQKAWDSFKLPGESVRKPLNLPFDVPANNMLTYRGRKMSKGDKIGITLETLMERYQPDIIRYFCARFAPEQTNREFIWKDFIDANNNELAANLGNFVNRVLSFTYTKFDGRIPEGSLTKEVKRHIDDTFDSVGQAIERCEFVKATEALLSLGKFANKYFNDEKPWETVKSNPAHARTSIYNSIQLVNALRILFKPFLPFTARKLANLLAIKAEADQNEELEENGRVSSSLNTWQFSEIPKGTSIRHPEILFPILEYTEELAAEDNPPPDMLVTTERISCNTSCNTSGIDPLIVVGRVQTSKPHPNAEKLQILNVEDSKQTSRSIVCGDLSVKAGDIVPIALPGAKTLDQNGKKIIIKRATIRGQDSDGMLCSPYEIGVGDDRDSILQLPASFESFIGQPLCRIRPVYFTKAESLEKIPTSWTVLGPITIRRNRTAALDQWIKEQIAHITKENARSNWNDSPRHKEYRHLHSQYSKEEIPGSAEEMVTEMLSKKAVPNINTLVDFYNTFSAVTGISIGAHDVAKLKGQPRFTILDTDIPFQHAATAQPDTARNGEYAYIDDEGILCRLDIKQGNRTTVTPRTMHALIIFQGNDSVPQEYLDEKMGEFIALAKTLL